jgi:hypothetical protein
MRVMHDGLTNRYSFKINGRPITLVSLTSNQIYDKQLKLKKKKKIVEKESMYIRGTFFTNNVLLSFDDVILLVGTDLLTLEDVFS